MIQGQRILERLAALSRSQAWLAREIGVSPQAVSKMVGGDTRETGKLYQLSRALETSPEYLTGETDVSTLASSAEGQAGFRHFPGQSVISEEEDEDTVEIQEIDIAYGMGGGSYLDIPVKSEGRIFSRKWLRMFTDAPPNRIFFASGTGDSMMPTILDGDVVLIDTSQMQPRMSDKIWALTYSGMGMIKRLRPTTDHGWSIMSDNPSVTPITAYDGEMAIVGRVVAIVRKV